MRLQDFSLHGAFLQPVRRLTAFAAAICENSCAMQSSCAQQLHPDVMSSPEWLSRRLISLGLCAFVLLSSILSLFSIPIIGLLSHSEP